jgi:site-specific DNA-methyltransferase (adenine-specific)
MEKVKISAIKANSKNPRVIKDDKFKKLVKSIQDFPEMLEKRPLVCFTDVDGKYVVLGGNMRLKAAQEVGLKELPIVLADDWTQEQRDEFLIKDNVGFGEWDWDQLANEWDAGKLDEWGLDVPNFDGEVLEAEEYDFDTTPPLEPITVLGDLYEIGEHRLLCGDSTDSDQVAKLIGNNKVDFIWTDPPYGINEKGDRSKRGGLAKGSNLPDFKDDTIQYAIDAFNQPFNLDVKTQVWFGANYYCHTLPQTANWLVWDKRVEDNQRDNNSDCELAWIKSNFSSIRIFRHLWKGMLKDSERGEKRVHATQKPIALVEFCINEYNKDCKTILDYFGGSGVCMVAAHQLKKQNLTMEFEPHNCDVIVNRMIALDPDIEIKLNGKPFEKAY